MRERGDVCLLHGILGFGVVSQHASGNPIETAIVPLHDGAKSIGIAREHAPHQLCIVRCNGGRPLRLLVGPWSVPLLPLGCICREEVPGLSENSGNLWHPGSLTNAFPGGTGQVVRQRQPEHDGHDRQRSHTCNFVGAICWREPPAVSLGRRRDVAVGPGQAGRLEPDVSASQDRGRRVSGSPRSRGRCSRHRADWARSSSNVSASAMASSS